MRAPQPQHDRPGQTGRCTRCAQPTYPRPAGLRFIEGRGLCDLCYPRAHRHGVLVDYERTKRTRDEVMDYWELLRSEGYSKRQAAARIGMSLEAFDRAFHRARRAGDPRALPALHRPPFGTRFTDREEAA